MCPMNATVLAAVISEYLVQPHRTPIISLVLGFDAATNIRPNRRAGNLAKSCALAVTATGWARGHQLPSRCSEWPDGSQQFLGRALVDSAGSAQELDLLSTDPVGAAAPGVPGTGGISRLKTDWPWQLHQRGSIELAATSGPQHWVAGSGRRRLIGTGRRRFQGPDGGGPLLRCST